jgi:PKD repeat protein
MAKLDSGIIAGLALGVGAYMLIRTTSGTKPNELKCKPNQHIERYNGIDTCVDNDDNNKPQCQTGYHLENGICTKNPSCPPNFHTENGICVPDLVCPTECSTGYHVENCKCVRDEYEPPKSIIQSFNYSPNNGVDLVKVNFNLNVSGTRNQIMWDFGDGSSIITGLTNPSHDFYTSSSGSVTVISEDGRSEEKTFSVNVTKRGDIPSDTKGKITTVSLSPKEGIAPLTVNASVSGTRKIQSAYWNFGDNKGITQGSSKGTVYDKSGTYNGEVKVTFDNGDVSIETFTVVVKELQLEASIRLYHPSPLKVNQQVIFTVNVRNAIGTTKVKWNFGDGNGITTDIFESPKHTYTHANTFNVSAIVTTGNGQSINDSTTVQVKGIDVTPPPIQCNTGFHLENGTCVPNEVEPIIPPTPPNTTTQVFKGVIARSGRIEKHPTSFTSTHLLINVSLPSRAKKIKYARIYFNGKADNYGFDGARAVVKFNGSILGTLNWSAFEDHKSKQLDVPVTSNMKESGYNKCEVIYTHSNNLFGQPLASGFVINGSDLYVEYEY